MAQQTAIEWLKDKLKETYDKEGKLPLAYTLHLVEQAKQIEKEQLINAHTNAYLIGEDDISVDDANEASIKYYNETYGGQGTPDTTSPNQ